MVGGEEEEEDDDDDFDFIKNNDRRFETLN
jgi:hypothetical protein